MGYILFSFGQFVIICGTFYIKWVVESDYFFLFKLFSINNSVITPLSSLFHVCYFCSTKMFCNCFAHSGFRFAKTYTKETEFNQMPKTKKTICAATNHLK